MWWIPPRYYCAGLVQVLTDSWRSYNQSLGFATKLEWDFFTASNAVTYVMIFKFKLLAISAIIPAQIVKPVQVAQ